MKAVNAYYRKNKTLDGCPHLSPEQIEKLKASMSGSYRANPKSFESYQLSNSNAEIRRLKNRITALTRRKELGYVDGEMRDFAARTLAKVGRMTEAEFAGLALYPAKWRSIA